MPRFKLSKTLAIVFIHVLMALSAMAQSTVVSGTLVDSTSTIYSNAKIQISFRQTPGIPGPFCFVNDCSASWQGPFNTTTDGAGTFSITLPANTSITPSGSNWTFQIGPNASAQAVTLNLSITGPTQDISTQFTAAAPALKIQSMAVPRTYNDASTVTPPNVGQLVYDTTAKSFKFWENNTWNIFGPLSGNILSGNFKKFGIYTQPAQPTTLGPGGNSSFAGMDPTNGFSIFPAVNNDFNVMGFGAVPDGTVCYNLNQSGLGVPCTYSGTDNTAAINNTIAAACAAGGGNIRFPAGVFNVINTPGAPRQGPTPTGPNTTNIAAITIACNNIHFIGAGKGKTTISFWIKDSLGNPVQVTSICPANPDFTSGVNPSFNYPRTWRGAIIYVTGSLDINNPRDNVTFEGMRLTANAAITGNSVNPVRADPRVPLPSWSACNGWDTSQKGIYLQNDAFTGPPNDPAFYPPVNVFYRNISTNDMQFDHIMGEEFYSGNEILTPSSHHDDTFAWTNGDGMSFGGAMQINNNIFDHNYANATENTPLTEEVQINGNIVTNSQSGINVGNNEFFQQFPDWPEITISHNQCKNVVLGCVASFSPIKHKITNNKFTDCAMRGAGGDSSSCIRVEGLGTDFPITWGPPAPAVPSVTMTGAGTIPAGTLQVAVAVAFKNTYILGLSQASSCTSVASGGTSGALVNRPAIPSNGVGWYVYATVGGSCTGLQLQSGLQFIPASQATFTFTSLLTGTPGAPTATQVHAPVPTLTDVIDNTITADENSITSPYGGFGLKSGYITFTSDSNNFLNNTVKLSSQNTATAVATPIVAPNANVTVGPSYVPSVQPLLAAGNYFFYTTWLAHGCETPPSPAANVTTVAFDEVDITPGGTPPDGVWGFKVYAGIVNDPAQSALQSNNANSITVFGNTYAQQYAILTQAGGSVAPPTLPCTGVNVKQPMNFGNGNNITQANPSFINTVIEGNKATGTTFGSAYLAKLIDYQAPNTSLQSGIVQFRPSFMETLHVYFSYTIHTAGGPSQVTAVVNYQDEENNPQTLRITPAQVGTGTGQTAGKFTWERDITTNGASVVSIDFTTNNPTNVNVNSWIVDK